MVKLIFSILGLSLLTGCLASTPARQVPESDISKSKEDIKLYCDSLRQNLPKEDKFFELKGEILKDLGYGNRLSEKIIQFGKKDNYYKYFVESSNCGNFFFYQISEISRTSDVRTEKSIKYKVLLKNGESFVTQNPLFIYQWKPDGLYPIMKNDADVNKTYYFRYITANPSVRGEIEEAIDPLRIINLKIE